MRMKKFFTLLSIIALAFCVNAQKLTFAVDGVSVANGSTVVYKTLDPDWEALGGVVFAPSITVTTDAAATVTVTGKETTGQIFSMCFGGNCVMDKEITKQKTLAANESVDIEFDAGIDNPMLGGIKTFTVDLKAYVEGKESEGAFFTIICSNDPEVGGVNVVEIANRILVSNGVLHYAFASSSARTISIYALTGQKLGQYAVNSASGTISLQDMPKGMYLYRIQSSGKPVAGKILVR